MADKDATMATESPRGADEQEEGQPAGGDRARAAADADADADAGAGGGGGNAPPPSIPHATTTTINPAAAEGDDDDDMEADGGNIAAAAAGPSAPPPPPHAARPPSAAAPLMPPPSAAFAVPSRPRVLTAINVARDPVEEGSFEVRSPPTTRMRLTPPSVEAGGGGALGGGGSGAGGGSGGNTVALGGGVSGGSTVVEALGSPLSAPGVPRDRPSGPRPLHHHHSMGAMGARSGGLGDALRAGSGGGGGGSSAAAAATHTQQLQQQQQQQASGGFASPQRRLGGITHVSSEPAFGLPRGSGDGGGGGGGSGPGPGESPARTPLAAGKPGEFRFAAAELEVSLKGGRSPSLIGTGVLPRHQASAAAAAAAGAGAAAAAPRPQNNQQQQHHNQTPQPLAPGATRTPSGRPFTQQQQAQMMLGLLGGGGTPQQRGRSFEGEPPPPLSLAAATAQADAGGGGGGGGGGAGRGGSPAAAHHRHRPNPPAAGAGGSTPLSATARAAAAAAAAGAAAGAGAASGAGPTPPPAKRADAEEGLAAADNGYGTLWDEPMIARHASGKSGKAEEDELEAAAQAQHAQAQAGDDADDGRGPAAMQESQQQQRREQVMAHAVEEEEEEDGDAEGIDEEEEEEEHKGEAQAHALAGQGEEEEGDGEEEGDEDDDDDDDDDDDEGDGAAMARAEHGGLAAFLHGAAGAWGALPPRVCVNCTARVYGPAPCFSCGHRREDDALLLAGRLPTPAPPPPADAPAHGPEGAPLLVYDDRLLRHHATEDGAPDPTHPERPDRAAVVIARLEATGLAARCRRAPCRPATWGELTAVHDPALVRELEAQCSQMEAAVAAGIAPGPDAIGIACGREAGLGRVLDCYLGPETFECARLAAGAAAEAAVAVARGAAPCAAAVIRPPGHHAESGLAMGFCFFNNAAVAARAAQRAGCRRVLVLDNDVHHGNGTQHIFEGDPTVLYASVHRHDGGAFFPGTGAADEVGTGAGEGFTVNVPWSGPGPGDGDYVAAFCRVFLPVAYEFAPDLVILSAGFDAAAGDPLGGCRVTPAGYAHMVALLRPVAPLVVLLEGGYNLRATAESVEACVRVLAGERPAPLPRPAAPTEVGLAGVAAAVAAQRRYWRCLADAPPPPAAMAVAPRPLEGGGEEDLELEEEELEGGGEEDLELEEEELEGGGEEDLELEEEELEEEELEEEEHGGSGGGGGGGVVDEGGAGGVNDAGGAAADDRHAGGGIGDGNNLRFALTIPPEAAHEDGDARAVAAAAAAAAGGAAAAGRSAMPGLDVGALASPPALVSPMMHLSGGAPAADHAMGEQQQQQQGGGGGG